MFQIVEFVKDCFSFVNLPYTVFLLANLAYWFMVILGALEADSLDVDLDMHHDFDMDHDIDMHHDFDAHGDADGDIEGGSGPGVFVSILKFFNVGELPLMILLGFLSLSMWAIAISIHKILGVESSLFAFILLFPITISSLFVTKIVTTPFRKLYSQLLKEEGIAHEKLTGKVCKVISNQVTGTFGQAEIKTDGSPILINVRSIKEEVLQKGEEAVIVSSDKDKGIYTIKKLGI